MVDVNDRRSFSLKLTEEGIAAFKKNRLESVAVRECLQPGRAVEK